MKRKTTKITLTLTIFLALAMFAGCRGLLSGAIDEPTATETSSGGTETASAGKILVVAYLESAESSSRAAIPSAMSSSANFSYFGALKTSESDTSAVYKKGTLSDGKLTFEFDSISKTTGLILEVVAYPDTTLTTKPATTASLSATKSGLSVENNKITISEKLSFKLTTSSGTGSVNLSITLPADYSLEVKNSTDSTTFTASQDGTAVKISASGVPANSYTLVFIVKNSSGNIVYGWTETIVVYAGMATDAWLLADGTTLTAAKEVTADTITAPASAQKIFYVRGASDTWYSTNLSSATASDSNPGTLMQPLSTVQAAIDKVKAVNNGSSQYTIYVDGTVTASGSTPVADFTEITSGCSVTLKGLDAENKATLDGNGTAQVIIAGIYDETAIDLNLTLENLIVTKGNGTNGGGIYINTSGEVEITNCKITSNEATNKGGGVYVGSSGTFKISGAAQIPVGDDGKNDVYLPDGKYITITGALTGTTPVATITPSSYDSNTKILTAGSGVTMSQAICNQFALSNNDYSLIPSDTDGVISRSYYVSNTGNDTTGTGTVSAPYATVQKAITEILNVNNQVQTYSIYVTGEVTTTTNTPVANFEDLTFGKKLILKIAKAPSAASATLTGNGTSVISTGDPIGYDYAGDQKTLDLTLKDLTITGGNANYGGGIKFYGTGTSTLTLENCTVTGNGGDYGGGMMVNGGTVTLQGSTTITGNTSTGNGGGITLFPVDSTAVKLILKDNASITGNTCSATTNEDSDGVIVQYNGGIGANLEIQDAAKIDYVNLAENTFITITGDLTASSPVATITPQSCTTGTKILGGTSELVSANYTKFSLSSSNCEIEKTGCLKQLVQPVSQATTTLANATSTETVNIAVSVSNATELTDLATAVKNTNAKEVNLVLSEGLTEIGDSTFNNCQKLVSIVIPASVTKIGNHAFVFYNQTNLKSVEFRETSNWYSTTAANYTGGTSIDVSDPVTNASNFGADSKWYNNFLYRSVP